jgi:acyl-coenzyme A synthetase/AMP-(fatty) acid ligase
MMWPYMLGGLACGARIILYDGSPFYPDLKTYLRFIDEQEYASFLPLVVPQLTQVPQCHAFWYEPPLPG